jgi:hypothetical protein
MPTSYSWLKLSTAVAQLSQRLNDPNNIFSVYNECVIYIQQALRMFNCLTFTWKADFTYSSSNLWNSLATLTSSPRLRTQTDTNCYTQMQYMLLEPPTGGTWSGTSQFNIAQFSQALQSRRDEVIQVGNLNQVFMSGIALTPNTRRTYLPDNVLDVARVRYIPVSGNPTTLFRDDMIGAEFYQAPIYQQPSGTPQAFSLSSEPPLSWDVNIPPNQPGTYEAIALQSGTAFSPPAPTLLNIPDDFSWALIYGALSDVLGNEPEATDSARANYCMKRYQDGLMLLQKIPWLMLGKVNGIAVTCDSLFSTDRYMTNWDTNPTSFGPVIVTSGVDLIAAPVGSGIGVTCLGNAPIPVNPTDYVQVDRADWDTVLDLAQALACFKMGGADWQQALELEARAIQACSAENTRLRSFGAFSDILVQRGQQEDRDQNRFNTNQKKQ